MDRPYPGFAHFRGIGSFSGHRDGQSNDGYRVEHDGLGAPCSRMPDFGDTRDLHGDRAWLGLVSPRSRPTRQYDLSTAGLSGWALGAANANADDHRCDLGMDTNPRHGRAWLGRDQRNRMGTTPHGFAACLDARGSGGGLFRAIASSAHSTARTNVQGKDKKALEHVPEKCGRFSDKNRLEIKGIEHFR